MKICYAAFTDEGRIRKNNEDNLYINNQYKQDVEQLKMRLEGSTYDCCFLASVCDGMGGESYGELASLEAVGSLYPCEFDNIEQIALECIQSVNQNICDAMLSSDGKRRGTTIVSLYIDDGKAKCINVGDSRAYLFRDGDLLQISEDHNKAAVLVKLGIMTKEEAQEKGISHELTQHLGIFEDEMIIEPFISEDVEIENGDWFLLCSDGLTDMLSDDEILNVMKSDMNVKDKVDELIKNALLNGGRDNVTVILLQIVEENRLTTKQSDKQDNNRSLVNSIKLLLNKVAKSRKKPEK